VAATELKSKIQIGGMVKSFERLTIGASAETLATCGATIPSGTTQILCLPSAILTHHPSGTPTASYGHAIAANEAFVIEHQDIPRTKIFATGGDQTMDVVYFGYESNF
jgi:hypothetical protein